MLFSFWSVVPRFSDPWFSQGRIGRRRWIGRRGCLWIAPLGAEKSVDTAVLVLHESHVVDVGVEALGFRDHAGFVPEAESIDAAFRFRDGEKAFSVPALDAHADDDFSLLLDGARIERGVDSEALHQERIGLRIEIVAPFQRHVVSTEFLRLMSVSWARRREARRAEVGLIMVDG